MKSIHFTNDSLSISGEELVNSYTYKNMSSCWKLRTCQMLEGTITLKKTVVLAICIFVLVAFAIFGGILGGTISAAPQIKPSPASSISNRASSPGLVIADDNNCTLGTGVLRGINECGRRAWDGQERKSHMVYLRETSSCLNQAEDAELQIPMHTRLHLYSGGSITQKRSSLLKMAVISDENNQSPKIDAVIMSSISLEEESSLTFIADGSPKVFNSFQFLGGNTCRIGFDRYNLAVSGQNRITIRRMKRRFGLDFEFPPGQTPMEILGAFSIESNGTLSISSPISRISDDSVKLESGSLIANITYDFHVYGKLFIPKGAILRLEGGHCKLVKNGAVLHGPGRSRYAELAADVKLTQGEVVTVRDGQPYHNGDATISCGPPYFDW